MENHVAQASVHAACSSMWLKGVISAIKEMKGLKGHRAGEEAALQGRSGGGCPRKSEHLLSPWSSSLTPLEASVTWASLQPHCQVN